MTDVKLPKYPLIWQKDDLFIKVFTSIPELATGILLRAGSENIIIDPGDGILRDLNNEIGKDKILEIEHIFITHGHHDHVGGVWSVLTYLLIMKKNNPLNIYFPEGCVELDSIIKAFQGVYGSQICYQLNLVPLKDSDKVEIGQLNVISFNVLHREKEKDGKIKDIPSVGYKFEYNGKSITYGGDTAYSESLLKMASESDLAIVEAGAGDSSDSSLHMTFDEAAKIGGKAKEYFVVHVPQKFFK